MSINRLNLQIGGGDQEDYEKRKVMREITKEEKNIDDLMEDLFFEEMVAPALSGEKPQAGRQQIQEEIVYREPRSNVDILSNYITKTIKEEPQEYKSPRSLRETYTVEDRIALLEQDVFTQMAKGTPNTLVAGIGASLDSGGGAVWLWDLEDVSIGAPLNGAYPSITDGSFLAYNAATKSWNAVEDAGAANALSGAVIKATGGSANSGGNLVIEATNATNGNFTIKNVSAATTFTVDGSTGNMHVNGGKVTIARSVTAAGNFNVKGRTVNFDQDPDSVLLGTVFNTAFTGSDSVRYFGTVTDDNDIANKKYVDDALDGLDPSGGFTFKGTTDITGTAPSSPAAGDFYINLVAGTAAASWTGIATLAIAEDQLVIYSGSSNRWFAGAVEGVNPNVLKAGDTMTGALTIAPASGSNGLIIKDGSTTKTQLFKGGAATFGGTVTAGNVSSGNIKPTVDDTYVLGDSGLSWSSAHINEVHSAGIINSGTLTSSGTTQLGTATAGTRIILGNTNMVGNASSPSYEIEGGASANIIIDRCADNSMSFPQIIIQGKTTANDGVKTNDLLAVTREAGNVADSIMYEGRTSGNFDVQTKTSALGLITAGGWTVTGTATFDGSSTFNGNTTTQSINVGGTAVLSGTTSFTGTLNNGTSGHILLTRPTGSSWFKIQGRTQSGGSTTNTLFDVEKGAGNGLDKIVYYGDTTSVGGEIQTKDSVQAMIDAQISAWTTINSGTSGQSTSTMLGGSWYLKYRTTNGGTTVEMQIHAAKNGVKVTGGDIVAVLPSSLRPSKEVPILFAAKDAPNDLSQGPGAFGVIMTTGTVAVTYALSTNLSTQTGNAVGAQDYWANFSYTLE